MLIDDISAIMQERGKPMSAAEVTHALADKGQLPEMCTVIDVADEMKKWFSPVEDSGND